MPVRSAAWRGTLFVLLAAASFGTTTIITQRALDRGAALPAFLAWRYALAVVLLTLVAGGIRGVRQVGAAWPRLVVVGGGAQALITALSLSALLFVPPATVGFLFYTYPTWVTVRAMLGGSERVSPVKLAALALSFAGIVAIVGNPFSGGLDPRGAALALAAAVVYALLIPWLQKVQSGVAAEPASAWIALGACLAFIGYSAVQRAPLWPVSGPILGYALLAAVVPTTIAFIAFMRGLLALGPVRTSIMSTVEPFWTAILAALVLGQRIGGSVWLGGVLICSAVVLLHIQSQREGSA